MRRFNVLLLLVILSELLVLGEAQVKPLFINCGSNSSIDVDGRNWVGDSIPSENFTVSSHGFIASVAVVNVDLNYQSLYRTARIFNRTSNYTISVVPGTYFVRLHLVPFSFESFRANESAFDATANGLRLVSKFNVLGELSSKNLRSNSNSTSLVKEYFVNISSNQLVIDFIPDSGSFASISAIEVVPVFDQLFFDSATEVGGNGLRSDLNVAKRGMETMYRLNVGVPAIEIHEDRDLWRKWESDEWFMFSQNAASLLINSSSISYSRNDPLIAPLLIYETARVMTENDVIEKRFNMSWKFNVDPNFDYLIRLHFCELHYNNSNQRMFNVYINKKIAATNYDVFARAGGVNKAYHDDYINSISELASTLWLQLGPDALMSASSTDAILNGLEIFKLSRNGDLAHALNRSIVGGKEFAASKPKGKTIWLGVGAGILSVFVLSAIIGVCIFFICRRKAAPVKEAPPGWLPLLLHGGMQSTANAQACKSPSSAANGSVANRTGRKFSLLEITGATNNFDESLVIGAGGFGKVYKGEIEEGTAVAIKRANPQSEQGLAEFETEIATLSKLRHKHLVSMIGYCEDENEMILVYEYMANGTLRSHLFGTNRPPLNWKQRLQACMGAARGLHYLHTGAERGTIHRDVKTTNILLDESFVAKMSDFGLSKAGPALDRTHVSTAVKGSFGYLDPEYFRRQQLTQKSDVYSFGVVLFEVVCGRSVINPTLPKDQINLVEWAMRWQQRDLLEAIVDPQLGGNYSLESLKKLGEIAEKCLADEGKLRPTMGEVLWHLEYALQLHEGCVQNGCGFGDDIAYSLPRIKEGEGKEEQEEEEEEEEEDSRDPSSRKEACAEEMDLRKCHFSF